MHFSDESKFNLFGCDGRRYIRRGVGETLSPKCNKRSVMVWGMISAEGSSGPLVRLHGRVNAAIDKELVKQHVLPVLRNSASHIHAGKCPMSQDQYSHGLFQGRERHRYGSACPVPRPKPYRKCLQDSWRMFQSKKSKNNRTIMGCT